MRIVILSVLAGVLGLCDALGQWEAHPLPEDMDCEFVQDIYFTGSETGFLSGCSDFSAWNTVGLYSTRDGGVTWQLILTTSGGGCLIPSHFVGEENGLSIRTFGTQQPNQMLRTANGGRDWEDIQFTSGFDLGSEYFTGGIFGSADNLLLQKDDSVFVSETGGWRKIFSEKGINDIQVTNAGTVYIAASHSLYRSTDNGVTWLDLGLPISARAMTFPSDLSGYMMGTDGTIAKTEDGGVTWEIVNTAPPGTNEYTDISSAEGGLCVAVGEGGKILCTLDGGVTWAEESVEPGINLWKVACTGQKAYAAGDGSLLFTRAIAKSDTRIETAEHLRLHIDPGMEELTIELDGGRDTYSFEIAEVGGRIVLEGQTDLNIVRIDIRALALGNYYVRLYKNNRVIASSAFIKT